MAASDIPKAMLDGSPPVRIEVDGRGFLWAATGMWGHEPFGANPILWACELCSALTADPQAHGKHHKQEEL